MKPSKNPLKKNVELTPTLLQIVQELERDFGIPFSSVVRQGILAIYRSTTGRPIPK